MPFGSCIRQRLFGDGDSSGSRCCARRSSSHGISIDKSYVRPCTAGSRCPAEGSKELGICRSCSCAYSKGTVGSCIWQRLFGDGDSSGSRCCARRSSSHGISIDKSYVRPCTAGSRCSAESSKELGICRSCSCTYSKGAVGPCIWQRLFGDGDSSGGRCCARRRSSHGISIDKSYVRPCTAGSR